MKDVSIRISWVQTHSHSFVLRHLVLFFPLHFFFNDLCFVFFSSSSSSSFVPVFFYAAGTLGYRRRISRKSQQHYRAILQFIWNDLEGDTLTHILFLHILPTPFFMLIEHCDFQYMVDFNEFVESLLNEEFISVRSCEIKILKNTATRPRRLATSMISPDLFLIVNLPPRVF